ncbi:MAG: 5-dehydro-2-deoxygluconokinase [Pseudomonadota bacterium]|nr:5-dehydro-2-deoxygluconokinase [Pseudomonadota bacterium]
MTKDIDLACLGRLAIDLYGVQRMTSLEEATGFRRYLGGSSGNLAVGSARQGLRTAMITRVGQDPMGRFLLGRLGAEGIDHSAVTSDLGRKTALAFLGMLSAEAYGLDFYRENVADTAIRSEDLPEGFLARVKVLAVTGTHFADEKTFGACTRIVELAAEAGCKIVLDIDLREALWKAVEGGLDEAASRVARLAECADLIAGNEDEFRVLSGEHEITRAVGWLRARTGALLIVKLGANGSAVVRDTVPKSRDALATVPGFPVEVVNPVGAGDAFLSGFLSAWIDGQPDAEALLRGNAAGALVVNRHACSDAMPFAEEVDLFRSGCSSEDPRLAHIHRARTRRQRPERVLALACDHRMPFRELMQKHGRSHTEAEHFKSLVVQAAERTIAERGLPNGGMLLDPQFGMAGLEQLGSAGWWLARPIEITTSRPLEVEAGANLAGEIATWNPTHVAKVLVWHHPSDEPALAAAQVATLKRLEAACHDAGIEWMLEVVPPTDIGHDDAILKSCVEQMYDAGLMPDYWKLPAMNEDAGWEALTALIEARDPWCRGVMVLGLEQPMQPLCESLARAARYEICAGFAVGRTIFGASARDWFSGAVDDATAVTEMANRFGRIVDAFNGDVEGEPIPTKAANDS